MIHSDDVERILLEIMLKREPAIPDTQELADLRSQLRTECDEIAAKGGTVQIPVELP